MNPRPSRAKLIFAILLSVSLGLLLTNLDGRVSRAQGGQVQVTAANPMAAEQGTINLNVKVTGKGFKNGAKAKWFVAGTSDPGGVTVNSTTFVSSTELTANITVSDTAVISNFDIQVLNSDGRGGKGTELFAVTAKGASKPGCTITLGTPTGYSLVATLNDGTSAAFLGTALAAAPTDSSHFAVAVGTGSSGYVEIFNLDASAGTVVSHQQLFVNKPIRWLAVGDINADGVPDFVGSNGDGPGPVLLRGSINSGTLSYSAMSFPTPPGFNGRKFRKTATLGNLDAIAGDEIVLASVTASGRSLPGQVHIYRFNGTSLEWARTIDDPATVKSGDFGYSVAISNLTTDIGNEIAVGALGRVVVSSSPLGTLTTISLNASGTNQLGIQVAGDDVNGDGFSDLVVAESNSVLIYPGPVNALSTPWYQLNPDPGDLGGIWAVWGFHALSDISGDRSADVLVGTPAPQGGLCKIGSVHTFMSDAIMSLPTTTPTTALFQPPATNNDGSAYGSAIGAVSANPLLGHPAFVLVGDPSRNSSAGDVYVYRRN